MIVVALIVFAIVFAGGLLALRQHNRMFPDGLGPNWLGTSRYGRLARDEVHLAVRRSGITLSRTRGSRPRRRRKALLLAA
jgi:hypothetical protein